MKAASRLWGGYFGQLEAGVVDDAFTVEMKSPLLDFSFSFLRQQY
jgi:hypothetical protein